MDDRAKNKPASDHDWTVHSLNIHGIFFERWCEHVIEKNRRWSVRATQYPVAFSPTSGPVHKASSHESTLDIRAELNYHDGRYLNLLIECKKNNPEFIEWIFFHKSGSSPDVSFIASAISCPTANEDKERHILRPMLKELSLDMVIAEEGRETRGDYQSFKENRNKTKTANDSISNAAHQIALATQAIFLEEATDNQRRIPIKGAKQSRVEKQVFMPAIVTSARLFLCEFDPADVSPTTGEIPYDKVSMTEKPYLIFNYPLPSHLQMDRGHLLYLSSADKQDSLVRMHIIVVNGAHLAKFLDYLADSFHEFFYGM
jgi:hypothetical protein